MYTKQLQNYTYFFSTRILPFYMLFLSIMIHQFFPFPIISGSCHKRQKPQAPIRNRQTRKVANAKGLNRNTNLT